MFDVKSIPDAKIRGLYPVETEACHCRSLAEELVATSQAAEAGNEQERQLNRLRSSHEEVLFRTPLIVSLCACSAA